MFGSRSVTVHLLRGVGAMLLLLAALAAESLHPLLRLAAAGLAFLLPRGCPMCWLPW